MVYVFSVREFIIYLGGTYIPICMKWQGPHKNVYPSEDIYLRFTVTHTESVNVPIPNHQPSHAWRYPTDLTEYVLFPSRLVSLISHPPVKVCPVCTSRASS